MALTESDREIFRQRFRGPVEVLIGRMHSGFALMMITLPLLERLLRGRSQLKDGALGDQFYMELLKVFPALVDVKGTKAFWQCFRNGILHQTTFSLKRVGGGEFSGFIGFGELAGRAIAFRQSGDSDHTECMVDPVAFSRTVLDEVENDLETFQGADPDEHPIPFVQNLAGDAWSFQIPLKDVVVGENPDRDQP